MHQHRLRDLVADAQRRVQRGRRVLEDHGDRASAEPPVLLLGKPDQGVAAEPHGAVRDAPRRVEQAHDRERGDGLARPRLADDCDPLSRGNGEGDVVDRAHHAVVGGELDAQLLDLQQRVSRRAADSGRHRHTRTGRRGSSASRTPSPTKLTASTVEKIARPGNTVSHQ